MRVADVQEKLETMQEFRNSMQDFYRVKNRLKALKRQNESRFTSSCIDDERYESQVQQLQPDYQEARRKVAREIAEATEIAGDMGIPTRLHLFAPPMFGGRSMGAGNVFQAAIEENLPFEFEIGEQQILDLIDQTIFACERLIKKQVPTKKLAALVEPTPASPPSTAVEMSPKPAVGRTVTGKIVIAVLDNIINNIVTWALAGLVTLGTILYGYFF